MKKPIVPHTQLVPNYRAIARMKLKPRIKRGPIRKKLQANMFVRKAFETGERVFVIFIFGTMNEIHSTLHNIFSGKARRLSRDVVRRSIKNVHIGETHKRTRRQL